VPVSPQPFEDDQVILRQRLELFLTWLGIIAGGLVVMMLLVTAFGGRLQLEGVLLSGAGCFVCFTARRLVRQDRILLAIYLFCGDLLLATLVPVLTSFVSPPLVLLPVMALAVTLPCVRGTALRNLLVIVWFLAVLFIGIGLFLQKERPPVVYTLDQVIVIIIAYGAMLGILFFLLWQYNLRIHEALKRANSAQSVLSSAYADLETHAAETRRLLIEKTVAESESELKTKFLANMSHELRTPLNAVLNFAHFLSDPEIGGRLSAQQQVFQQRIVHNAEHLLGLINDILDLSKIEAGKMELFCEALELPPLFESVMSTAIALTRKANLTLSLDVAEGLPRVWADQTRVQQVLLNLLSNAAKFTRQGGIMLRAHRLDDGFVQLAVEDTGIGIPPEHHAGVFEEFQQVQNELAPNYQGTGLGLPICKRLVEMHGGRMWLESTVGVGSTFYFTLPVYDPSLKQP
jgi:signal transduction histidine kinase